MKTFWMNLVVAFALVHALPVASFAIENPLHDPSKLARPVHEKMVRVTTAKIVIADYALIRKDFPELRNLSESDIDSWILRHAAFVSKPQAAQEIVNTKIQTAEEVDAFRPEDYGRAGVFVAGSGLIDAKGIGSAKPLQRDHSNGLATLGESLREFLYEKLTNKILKHSGSGIETVGTYAIIDYGFDVKHADGATSPAGEVLRQGHQRMKSAGSLLDDDTSLKIEKILRRYGVTSAGAYHDEAVQLINIQGTAAKDGILDFGGFLVKDHFDKPAKNGYGRSILLDPKKPGYVEPEASLQLPVNLWGTTATGKLDPKQDNAWVWSHDLADHLRSGQAQRKDVDTHYRNFMDPVDRILNAHPVAATPVHATGEKCSMADRIMSAFRK